MTNKFRWPELAPSRYSRVATLLAESARSVVRGSRSSDPERPVDGVGRLTRAGRAGSDRLGPWRLAVSGPPFRVETPVTIRPRKRRPVQWNGPRQRIRLLEGRDRIGCGLFQWKRWGWTVRQGAAPHPFVSGGTARQGGGGGRTVSRDGERTKSLLSKQNPQTRQKQNLRRWEWSSSSGVRLVTPVLLVSPPTVSSVSTRNEGVGVDCPISSATLADSRLASDSHASLAPNRTVLLSFTTLRSLLRARTRPSVSTPPPRRTRHQAYGPIAPVPGPSRLHPKPCPAGPGWLSPRSSLR